MKPCDVNCNCTIFHQDILDEVQSSFYKDQEFSDLVSLFKIFADMTRIKILEAIKEHELCVCDLAYLLGVSKSAISHQMKYLKSYHLVSSSKQGKMVYYRLSNQNAREIITHAYAMMKGIGS
ncbi:MAG: metalloregulator ArsR/SmtB family transcription factor [Acholeplasmataceae bacterium]|nr:metalloregulator ArsR/SmtB family transcription factor [Acholeplasmataceae bacterium]